MCYYFISHLQFKWKILQRAETSVRCDSSSAATPRTTGIVVFFRSNSISKVAKEVQSERYWLVAVNQKHCVKVCVRVKPVKRKGLGIPAAATCFVTTETPASSANPSFSPAGTISSSTRWTGNTQRNLDHFTALTHECGIPLETCIPLLKSAV